jgi:hypothetical protein
MKKSLFVLSALLLASSMASAQEAYTLANCAATGTTLNTLTKRINSSGNSCAVIVATTDTTGAIGITTKGNGTTGLAEITRGGIVPCLFDNATTAEDYVQISSVTAGNCRDVGATRPTSGQVIGRIIGTGGGAGVYNVALDKDIYPSAAVAAAFIKLGYGDNGTNTSFNGAATNLFGFTPLGNFTTTQFGYKVAVADNTANLYDFGIYNSSGTLLCHIGATAGTTLAPSTGAKNIAWLASCSLLAGNLYFFGITGNASTFKLSGTISVNPYCAANPSSGNTTTGGVLNSSITPPAGTIASCNYPEGMIW